MRLLLFALLTVTSTVALVGQDVIEQGFGIEIAPHYGSRRISAGNGLVSLDLERQDSLESGVGGYGFGLIYTSRVNKIGFTTGLRYLETGYSVAEQPEDRLNPTGPSFSQEVRAKYVTLPFELNFYQDIKPKDRVFFTLGLAAHFHLKTTARQTNFSDGQQLEEVILEDDPDQSFRSPIVSLNTSVGFDRKFNERWSIRLEPYFQFFLQGNLKQNFNQTNRNYYQLGGRVLVRRSI